ncbi:replication protein RepA [Granulicella tundricola]|uniref:Plasmid encoded RepA protein n=1 Tax=Granulicella tundricola (strain ATCC BAA-1859 / DSM 23138 / MP5ACTX9) TaxID=1198114 RepID=E8X7M4_GRATM|nr:replication protein RepA [Granulicella tundricola]ADW71458.1 plasmid encoded RepA protein [Granulicella tundricola MP5ACTX9]
MPRKDPDASKSSFFLDKLLDAAVDIKQNPEAAERVYMARHLVQCTLPHSDPGNVNIWRRRNGNVTLSIRPHIGKDDKALYPYGSIPRLLLFWMVTEATRTKSRRITLGDSLPDFMREIGLNPRNGSGERSDVARLKEQMTRLFTAQINVEQAEEAHEMNVYMPVTSKTEFWWAFKTSADRSLWDSWIELGEDFFKMVTASPVPVDMRALRALKRSPLALDLYAWLTYTVFAANKNKANRIVPWKGLHDQMGGEYARTRDFRSKTLEAIKKIKLVYPALVIESTDEYLIVHPAKTAIESKE